MLLAEIDSFVIAVKLKASFFIERNGALIAVIDREANRFSVGQENRRELLQASQSVTFPSFLRMHVNALKVGNLRSLTDHISFEDEAVVFNQHPNPVLFDASRGAAAKAAGIALQRIAAAFFQRHRGVDGNDLFEISHGRRSQAN